MCPAAGMHFEMESVLATTNASSQADCTGTGISERRRPGRFISFLSKRGGLWVEYNYGRWNADMDDTRWSLGKINSSTSTVYLIGT